MPKHPSQSDTAAGPRAPETMTSHILPRLLHAHPETAFDYLEFRRLLAVQAAALAAQRADQSDLAAITSAMRAMENAHVLDAPDQEAAADATFHLAIYRAAKNTVMTHIMGNLFEMLRSGVFYDRADLYLRRGVRESFLRQHQAIHDAIAARDPARAMATADAHIRATTEALREAQKADQRREAAIRRRDGLELTVKPKRSI